MSNFSESPLLVGYAFGTPGDYFLIVVTIFFILLGVFGNGLIIVSVIIERKLRTRCNAFLLTLALADITIQGYILPFTLADFFYGHYPTGVVFCKFNAFLVCYCYGLSLWSLAFLAVNRYVKICHPVRYDVWLSRKNTVIFTIILYIIPIPMNISPMLGFGIMGYDTFLHLCSYLREGGLTFTLLQMIVTVFIPMIIVCVFYGKIFLKVINVRRKIQKVFPNPSATYIVSKFSKQDLMLAYSLFIVFVTLVCLMTPYAITTIFDVNNKWSPEIHMASLYLAYTNSWVNWIIYGLMNVNFRKTYKQLLCRRSCSNDNCN